ncbi:amidohydrolase family protein [Virgibacillus halodenitrificans]|uniref:amidohydrolase n=1 Tax=Virgibacillus halodenitrificans TaxID=1482 RepID=UPI00136B3489|nr:amidohydrolase [Virgibacillus halodenitrificans]MYL44488.1 amidohydrolase family protein [Virgibacillus halodenitrificans]
MGRLVIKNALLECGFNDEFQQPASTITEKKDILIEHGIIKEVSDSIQDTAEAEILDARGQLILPSFKEMHIHIDKTYFGGPWKACKPITNGILTRIEEETKLLPEQLKHAPERADLFIQHLIKHGHTYIRSHCNIDPSIGLENLKVTVNALEKYKDKISYDIVAFPQHGLLRSEVEPLMREAMSSGATLVGGVDPATIDKNIDKSLETMFDIALEANTGLDLHLHDPDTLGEFTFYKLIELTHKHGLEGNVTISHAIALGDLHGEPLSNMLKAIKKAGIDITTTIPINRPTIPVIALDQAGVSVSVGHDSLTDHWSPFGSGDTIEKLSILAERFRLSDERSLSQAWKYASGGITPLDKAGNQVWPKIGDVANMLIVDAGCSAETVARRKPITHTIAEGKVIN